jgi:molybdopterin-guanine dinucleotide biosynthesis protein A
VLAGGRSSRMGRDKALLPYAGQLLIEHALEQLRLAGTEPVIAGSRPDLAAYAPVLEDLHPACGPLSGIESALSRVSAAADQPVLFVPVDLPLLPASFLATLLDRAARTGALATIPLVGGYPQPLCAVYRSSLLPGIAGALEDGDYKVMRVMHSLTTSRSIDLFNVEALFAALDDPAQMLGNSYLWFSNVNTPADLQAIERAIPQPSRIDSRSSTGA